MSKASDAIKQIEGMREMLSEILSAKPKDVNGQYNAICGLYKKQLTNMIFSRFAFKIPEWWDYEFFTENLFMNGYLLVSDIDSVGVIPQKGSISGVNIWGRPLDATIINPILGNFDRTIGVDCCIIKIGFNYNENIVPLVKHYAELLASCDCSIDVNLMNTRVATIFECEDKAQEITAKKVYDDLSMGKPAVFVKKNLGMSFYQNNVRNTYIADDIQLLKSKIYSEFLTRIGVNNANTDKRERLITQEVQANDQQMMLEVRPWLYNINKSFEKVNKMFGLNCVCTLVDLDDSGNRTEEKDGDENGESS